MLWLVSVYCQAIARNSNMLNICTTMAAGGPATDMLFYEMVNGAIARTVSGAHSVQGGIARDKPLGFYVDIYRKKKEEIQKLGIDYSVL